MYWILLIFLTIGLFYPIIGFIAIICMAGPVVLAFFKGRYWCGHICPRGSFYDKLLFHLSPHKPAPAFLRSKGFRIFMLGLILTVFSTQMYFAWGDLAAMGAVFINLILITTAVGIVLGIVYHQRTWCTFCPMGTLACWAAPKKK